MAFILNGKSYTKPEFWRLLASKNQQIKFSEVSKAHSHRLLDGESLEVALHQFMIYTRKRDGMAFAVTSR